MEISASIATSVASKLLLLPRLSLSPTSAVRSDTCRYSSSPVPRALVRRSRRIRRKSVDSNGPDDLLSGDGDDGPFGGGGGGGGSGRWSGGGGGGENGWGWEENGSGSSPDRAFDFVYEVMIWVALSNCTHFAVKRLGRILEERGKVERAVRLVSSMC